MKEEGRYIHSHTPSLLPYDEYHHKAMWSSWYTNSRSSRVSAPQTARVDVTSAPGRHEFAPRPDAATSSSRRANARSSSGVTSCFSMSATACSTSCRSRTLSTFQASPSPLYRERESMRCMLATHASSAAVLSGAIVERPASGRERSRSDRKRARLMVIETKNKDLKPWSHDSSPWRGC